eukprot:GHVN01058606.1.p1 GENE.GHVN01058606.1~~GHVN01058606.1.p1  ORF type:complete len:1098 (-),score=117.67 GHVN01058606.1:3990-7283(-)
MSGLPVTGGEAPIETNPSAKVQIEKRKPMVDSLMWDILGNYYKKMASDAWAHNYVPMFVTSNSRLARNYSDVAQAFFCDWFRKPLCERYSNDSGEEIAGNTVYIVEIGGGHGRFSFLFVKHLLRYRDTWAALGIPEKPFVYVFTDVAEANVAFCEKHPRFQELIKDGWLDFALFDANAVDASIKLRKSGVTIPRYAPIFAIANYVLDSLLTDALQFSPQNASQEGTEHEENSAVSGSETISVCKKALVSIYSPIEEPCLTDPALIGRISFSWDWEEIGFDFSSYHSGPLYTFDSQGFLVPPTDEPPSSPPPIPNTSVLPPYMREDPFMVELVGLYASLRTPLSIILPVGALQLLRRLSDWSGHRLIVMVGDKGYPGIEEFKVQKDPHIAIHGSLSFMVNQHALRNYFQLMLPRGRSFTSYTPYRDTFQITAMFGVGSKEEYPLTAMTLDNNLSDFGPDSLIQFQRFSQEAGAQPPIRQLLALLRYSGHDPDVFWNFRTAIVQQCVAPHINPRTDADIALDLDRIFEMWYPLRDEEDVPDALGRTCMAIGDLERAIHFFQMSMKYSPQSERHPATRVNIATCLKSLGRMEEAMAATDAALSLVHNFGAAVELKSELTMCLNPVRLAVVGITLWARRDILPLIAIDRRVEIVAIFSFVPKEAEFIRSHLKLCPTKCQVFEGSSGLAEIVEDPSITACLVDVHPRLNNTLLPRMFERGKNVLCATPITHNVGDGLALIASYKTFTNIYSTIIEKDLVEAAGETYTGPSPPPNQERPFMPPPVWHVASTARSEEAFKKAAARLKSLGDPISFAIHHLKKPLLEPGSATVTGTPAAGTPASQGEEKPNNESAMDSVLLADATRCFTVLRILLGDSKRDPTAGDRSVPTFYEISSLSSHFVSNKSPDGALSGRVLNGWATLCLPSPSGSAGESGSDSGGASPNPLIGFITASHSTGTPLESYHITCTEGEMKVEKKQSSWQITTRHASSATPKVEVIQATALQCISNLFFHRVFYRRQITDQANSLLEATTDKVKPDVGSVKKMMQNLTDKVLPVTHVDRSIEDAVFDVGLLNGLQRSAGSGGAPVGFSYEKKDEDCSGTVVV